MNAKEANQPVAETGYCACGEPVTGERLNGYLDRGLEVMCGLCEAHAARMSSQDEAKPTIWRGRWSYHRDTNLRVSKWAMTDPMGRTHWITKFDAGKLCVIGYAGERTDWMVQEPSAARDAVECMVRSVLETHHGH